MRRTALAALGLATLASATRASAQPRLPFPSPAASVSQEIGTSRVTVAIRVDAKGLKGRLLLPLIGSQLPGQTGDAAASLKRLAEAGGGA